MKIFKLFAALAASLSLSAHAQVLTQIALPTLNTDISTWSNGSTYTPFFPGNQILGGIEFTLQQDGSGNKAFWQGTLDMNTDIAGATTVYTLINTAWGQNGANVGSITFTGSGGSVQTVALIMGDNVRDHYTGSYVNALSASYVTTNVIGSDAFNTAHLDMQAFSLSSAFQTERLTSITFTSAGNNPQGIPFLAGVTVAAVPEPTGLAMLLAGLGVLGLMLRRRV